MANGNKHVFIDMISVLQVSTEKMKASTNEKVNKINGKVPEKSSTAKANQLAKAKSQPNDHDYIESCTKVKVRDSIAFIQNITRQFVILIQLFCKHFDRR